MNPDDSVVTPDGGGRGTGVDRTREPGEIVDALQAAGDAESLPMRLALARTRVQLFDVSPRPTRLGRFEVLAVIGRGATAVVHTALDPRLNRIVALKVFARGLDAATSDRVVREARLAASLNHPNVVTVLDVGESGGRIWVAMERVEGRTLREVLRRTPSTWDELAPLFVPIAEGLGEVHRHGVVHRDVKPENILVDAAGRVVLTDFGVSTQGPMESEAGVGGTPAYMSPEQIEGGLVGAPSDQFSYCVMLYEALEGARPFAAPTLAERGVAIRRGPEAALAGRSMPSAVRAVLKRGLALDPAARFASMRSVAAALGHRRRRAWVPALVGGAALVAAGSTALGSAAPHSCDDERSATRTAWTVARDEVKAAFASGPEAFIVDGGPHVLANLDRYVEDLAETRGAVCEAHRRGTLLTSVAASRTECLGRRQEALDHLVASVEDVKHRSSAIAASYRLPPIEACLVSQPVAVPPDDLRAELEALEGELDALAEHEGTLAAPQRLAQAEVLVARAHTFGHRPSSIRALTALGNARMTLADFEGAHEAWERAYFLAQRAAMPERSLELATAVLSALARLGRYDQARDWARHARAALGRSPDPVAASRVDYTEAVVMLMFERPQLALPLLTRTLETREAVLGDAHPTVADTRLELGNAYLATGDFDRALEELRAARKIQADALGPRHPDVALVDNNLGAVQFRLGRFEAAAKRWEASLSIGAEAFGEDHISQHGTLTNLAKAAAVQGAWDDAQGYLDRALRVWDVAGLGSAHPELVGTLEVQGEVLLERGAAKDALQAYVQAIEICDAVYGSVVVPTLGPLAGAARAAWALEDAEAAAVHASRFLDSDDARLFSPQTHTGMVWLQAQALWKTGEHAASRRAAEAALATYRDLDDESAAQEVAQWLRAHHASDPA